jgi:hypothetical protein
MIDYQPRRKLYYPYLVSAALYLLQELTGKDTIQSTNRSQYSQDISSRHSRMWRQDIYFAVGLLSMGGRLLTLSIRKYIRFVLSLPASIDS